MPRYPRYLVQLSIAMLALCIGLVAADLLLMQSEPVAHMVSTLDDTAVDVAYFGDSTVYVMSQCVPERYTIDGWLRRLMPRSILSIHRDGNSPIVWQDYVKVMASRPHRPRLLVFPINLRSFSGAWFGNPSHQWRLDRLRARARYADFSVADLLAYLRARFTDEIAEQTEQWKRERVVYGDRDLGPRHALLDAMSIPGNAAIECSAGLEEQYARELGLLFQYHYGNVVDPAHPMLAAIGETAAAARRQGIGVLVYLTPINVEDGVRWVGSGFRARVAENVAVVRSFLEQQRIDFLDLSTTLPREHFIDRRYACGHLDERGRRLVAQRLARAIEARLD